MTGDHSPSFADLYLGAQIGAAAINSITVNAQSYAEANPIGAHGVAGYGHISHADALAAALFVSAAMDYGHATELSGFSTGYVGLAPGMAGTQAQDASSHADQARPVNLPGIARDLKAIVALKWPHGKCDPQGEIRRAAAQLGLSPYLDTINSNHSGAISLSGLRRIPSRWPSGMDGSFNPQGYFNTIHGSFFWDDVAPQVNEKDPSQCPNGWYRGAGGSTEFWREFYQMRPSTLNRMLWGAGLGAAAGLFLMTSLGGAILGGAAGAGAAWKWWRPKFEDWRTYLMVAGATWHYDKPDDYETLVAFSVISWPFGSGGTWSYDWNQVRAHRGYGEQLAQAFLRYLDAQPASAAAQDFRAQLRRVGPPSGGGKSPAAAVAPQRKP